MAYTRSSRRSRTAARPAARRTSRKAVSRKAYTPRPARRAPARKRAARAPRVGKPSTLKLVIETRASSPVSRLDGAPKVLTKPGKARL